MSTLHVLAFDTCGSEATVAVCRLCEDQLSLAASTTLPPRTAASQFTPALAELLHEANLQPAQLRAVLAVDGPGSFTGIRIGLATAKALAHACSVPLFTISRLCVLARTHAAQAAALDASRGELFLGRYTSDGREELLMPRSEAAAALQGQRVVICEPALTGFSPRAELVPPPTAFDAARAALGEILAGHAVDPVTLQGRYLRTDLYGKPA